MCKHRLPSCHLHSYKEKRWYKYILVNVRHIIKKYVEWKIRIVQIQGDINKCGIMWKYV